MIARFEGHQVHRVDDVAVVKHVRIPMGDGVRLACDLYTTPDLIDASAAPLPVVLDYIPYRKDEVALGGWGGWYYADLVRAGYTVARVDIRGTGSSEGVALDEYSDDELSDGYAVVEWLARQEWCDGHVCMTGISYGGFTSLLVAGRQPPSLTAIAPMYVGHDRYANGDHYRGGLLGMWFDLGYYGLYLSAFNFLPPDHNLDGWSEVWSKRLEDNEPYLLRWLRHQRDGPFWRGGSIGDIVDRINCPVLLIGGWRDAYPSSPLHLFERLRVPKRAIVGPWNHAVPDIAIPGPRIDYTREIVRWFDRWCGRTSDASDSPPVAVFMQTWSAPDRRSLEAAGEWRAESTWPPKDVTSISLHPAANGRLQDLADEGTDLLRAEPDVGTAAGLFCYMSFGQPEDQRRDEALSLVYTTAPLTAPLAVLGSPQAELCVSCEMQTLGLVVALSDVAPDGRSMLVAKGVLNATRRAGLDEPRPIEAGSPTDVRIDIDATGWRFEAGHRIRLSVASGEWPNLWPTPEVGVVALDRARSSLRLPVVPAQSTKASPRFHAARARDLASATVPDRWRLSRNLATGVAHYELGFAREYDADCGARRVRRQFDFEATLDPADPARAYARGRHQSDIESGSFGASATAEVTAQASASHFDVTIEVNVSGGDRAPWRKAWTERFPRDLL